MALHTHKLRKKKAGAKPTGRKFKLVRKPKVRIKKRRRLA